MAKIIFEFDSFEDKEDYEIILKAKDLYFVLWDLDGYLRNKLKYEVDFKTPDEAVEKIRDKLNELMEDHKVDFDLLS